MKKLYLDIDGVLLTKHNTKLIDSLLDFIDYVVTNYDCYWLTTHCRDGNNRNVINMLSYYFPSDYIVKLKPIKPTKWDTLKTDGIDLNSEFYWIDDYVFNAELNVLRQHNKLDSLKLLDNSKPIDMTNIIKFLKAHP